MTRRHWISLPTIAALMLVVTAVRSEDDPLKADLAALKSANLDTSTEALLRMIKKRTISEDTRATVAGLIRLLGADEFDEREKASKDLVEMGAAARPQLTFALKHDDLETRRRAREALDKIGPVSTDASILPAAARVLADRKAAGAAEALLDFLPSIEEKQTAIDVARAISGVVKDKDGKIDPAVMKALSDGKYPIRRWAAAEALTRGALKQQRESVMKMLEDENITVRRRVAVALTRDGRDKAGVPTLIKVLSSDSIEEFEDSDAVLRGIADALSEAGDKLGEKAPTEVDFDNPKSRQKYQQQWEGWWKEASAKIDLKKLDLETVGQNYTLVGAQVYKQNRYVHRLLELDSQGKEKWALDDVMYPVYASKTKRDRVLVAEFNANKVTERDTKSGKVLWTKALNSQPVYCERLNNGNTIIATRNELMEVDKAGTAVRTVNRNNTYDITTVGRHKDGSYTMLLNSGQVIRYDSSLKQTSTYNTGRYVSFQTGLKCAYLPNGGLVIPDYSNRKIREFDGSGKLQHEVDATYPTSVSKLPNGNYVYLNRQVQGGAIVEVDKAGKQISTKSVPLGDNVQRSTPLFMDRK